MSFFQFRSMAVMSVTVTVNFYFRTRCIVSCFILFRCVHQLTLQLIIKKETGDAHRQPPPPHCSAQESHQQLLPPELRVTPVPRPPAAASVGDTAAGQTPGETGERWQGGDRANQKDSAHLGDPSEHSEIDHRPTGTRFS